ncbi:hypothetical protein HJC23_004094 [Cyclotella cryptica]|uniref:Calmodulin-lysine N-methyltransferase n=1 Tax=Cyclotella cryptica TaxID=29204 RepID=A0ABD3P2D9_9STRA|eukprot:CCRYP_018215-RA/>CCRYP_018215-RA protein AED:0.43 eAED:0.43 QI:545/1/1/1/1/1/2/86/335
MNNLSLSPNNGGSLIKDQDEYFSEQEDPFLQQMNRGSYLRQLRLLALQDEMERLVQRDDEQEGECFEEKKCDDVAISTPQEVVEVRVLPSGERLLDYSAYLSHQRYYDDLKHVDMNYIDYGPVGIGGGENLIIEQRKQLGKGGFCWDAAFILGEHVIAHEPMWNTNGGDTAEKMTVLELGAGTGLCGMMIAKSTSAHVILTDLPELMGLIDDNLQRNFPSSESERIHGSKGTVESRVLRWGVEEDYGGAPFDVIVGADIVASLYDPIALAQTLHALSGPKTKIYISSKSRLDKPHEEFDTEMRRLFDRAERVQPQSRLRNPHVFAMIFDSKKDDY